MATLLTEIPGFGRVHAEESLERYRKDCIRALAEVLPYTVLAHRPIEDLLQSPYIQLLGDVEAFPTLARMEACASLLRRPVVYSPEDGTLYIDVSSSRTSGFAAEFVAEFGAAALLGTPTLERYEALAQDFLQQTHDTDAVKIFAGNYIRNIFESQCSHQPHGLFYCLVREFGHALLAGKVHIQKPIEERITEALDMEAGKGNPEIHLEHFWALALHNITEILSGTLQPIEHRTLPPIRTGTYPLSAVCTITEHALPSLAVLLGPSLAKAIEDSHTEFLEQFTWSLPTDDQKASNPSQSLFAHSPNDLQVLSNTEASPLSNLALCPLAEIQVRSDRRLTIQEDAAALLRVWRCDLSTRAADPLGFLPHIHTESSLSVRILSADVASSLHWAVLTLVPETQGPSYAFPAIFSGWTLQADRLKTNTVYKAHVGFWVSGHSDTSRADAQDSYTPGGNPLVHIRAHRTRRVTFQNRAIGSCIACARFTIHGKEMPVFMTSNRYHRLTKDSHADCSLQGYFFVECFEIDDPIQDRIHQLSSPPTSLNNLRALEALSESDARAAMALAQQMPTKNQAQREKRLRLIRHAAKSNLPEALYWDAKTQSEDKDQRKDGLFSCVLEMAKAASLGFPDAMDALIRQPFFRACVADDIREALLQTLATRFQHAPSQYRIAQRFGNPTDVSSKESSSQILRFAWLMQSFINGCDAGTYEIIQALSLGIGCSEDAGLVEQILRGASLRGCDEAQYWIAGLGRMGVAFFHASQSDRLRAFQAGVSEGIPSSALSLALFYEFDGSDLPNARLIAYGLYQWLEKTLGNPEVSALRDRAENALSDEDRKRLSWFDLWDAVGCSEPTNSLALENVTRTTQWHAVFSHPTFIRSLDPSAKEHTLSQRLLRQIDFFAENSSVVPLGLAHNPQDFVHPRRRLSVYQDGTGESSLRLLIASTREADHGPWSIASVYPLFSEGTNATITLHGALTCESKAASLLHMRIAAQHKKSDMLLAFDPVWPLAGSVYRTGQHYAAILYGLVYQLKFNASIFDDMPAHLIEQLQKQLEQIPLQKAQKKMVGFSAYGNEEGLYQLNTTVRSIGTSCTLGSLSFLRLEVDSFFVSDEKAATFTLYIDTKQHCKVRLPRIGERIDVILELHAYPIETTDKPNIVLN